MLRGFVANIRPYASGDVIVLAESYVVQIGYSNVKSLSLRCFTPTKIGWSLERSVIDTGNDAFKHTASAIGLRVSQSAFIFSIFCMPRPAISRSESSPSEGIASFAERFMLGDLAFASQDVAFETAFGNVELCKLRSFIDVSVAGLLQLVRSCPRHCLYWGIFIVQIVGSFKHCNVCAWHGPAQFIFFFIELYAL